MRAVGPFPQVDWPYRATTFGVSWAGSQVMPHGPVDRAGSQYAVAG